LPPARRQEGRALLSLFGVALVCLAVVGPGRRWHTTGINPRMGRRRTVVEPAAPRGRRLTGPRGPGRPWPAGAVGRGGRRLTLPRGTGGRRLSGAVGAGGLWLARTVGAGGWRRTGPRGAGWRRLSGAVGPWGRRLTGPRGTGRRRLTRAVGAG